MGLPFKYATPDSFFALQALALFLVTVGLDQLYQRIFSLAALEGGVLAPHLIVLVSQISAVVIGIVLLFLTGQRSLKSTSSVTVYGALAVMESLSSLCQIQAISLASMSAQSISKCAVMVSVLLVGRLVYKKSFVIREWLSGFVIFLGCTVYILTRRESSDVSSNSNGSSLGVLCLLVYFVLDGFIYTVRERALGKGETGGSLFLKSSVLNQIVWVNGMGSILTVATFALSQQGLSASLATISQSPTLAGNLLIFSCTSVAAMILLLNSIATFGALSTSMPINCRHFFAVLMQFGGMSSSSGTAGMAGWLGAGWVSSGVWIKLDASEAQSSYQLGLRGSPVRGKDGYHDNLFNEKASTDPDYQDEVEDIAWSQSERPWPPLRSFTKFVAPLLLPVVGALILQPLATTFIGSWTAADLAETRMIKVEGGQWSENLHNILRPTCPTGKVQTIPYPDQDIPRTAFASFPRSGNSYTRGLVERSTGFQTSSSLCNDKFFNATFFGECDRTSKFLIKTHVPVPRADNHDPIHAWAQYERALRVIRNPLDALWSYWHMIDSHAWSNTYRAENVTSLSLEKNPELKAFAGHYLYHWHYWNQVPYQVKTIQYEALRANTLAELMSILSFILPSDRLPPLEQMMCALEEDVEKQPYESRKEPPLHAWDNYEPETRKWLLEYLREPWCAEGYEAMLREKRGLTAVDCAAYDPVQYQSRGKRTLRRA